MKRWRCLVCNVVTSDAELLRARSPFADDGYTTIIACPHCGAVEHGVSVCDEPGCMWAADCGTPTDAGYRQTCGEHVPPCHRDPEVRQ